MDGVKYAGNCIVTESQLSSVFPDFFLTSVLRTDSCFQGPVLLPTDAMTLSGSFSLLGPLLLSRKVRAS